MKKLFIKYKLFFLLLVIFVFITCKISVAYSQSNQELLISESKIPTVISNGAKIPSWSEITFATMPPISSNGSFTAPKETKSQLGYDLSRTWSAGQTPDKYMKLGDLQDVFQLQRFTLDRIFSITGLDLNSLNLDSFDPIKSQTVETLLEAIPDIGKMPVSKVKPIYDLFAEQLSINRNSKINNILRQSPLLKKLKFKSLDLSKYPINSIPRLRSTPLAVWKNWQVANISGIPGLNQVPFTQFPSPIKAVGSTFGRVDIAFGTAEQQIKRTVSGSYKEGFSVPCKNNCAHVELSGVPSVNGKAWISGKYNKVKGGKGFLGRVNGGKEPTGRHPFGDAFKVVVWDTSEKDATAEQALFFRICRRHHFVDLGCTPYFIGPVPFLDYRETDPIFLGLVKDNSKNPSAPVLSAPSVVAFQASQTEDSQTNYIAELINDRQDSCSGTTIAGIDVEAFNQVVNPQENYDFLGNYLCDLKGNCGRSLGTIFHSYDPEVRAIISEKPGGSNFLSRLDTGESINSSEMLEFFSDIEQQKLALARTKNLLKNASQKIDPYTGEKLTEDRLTNYAAQMHFAGDIPVDAEVVNSSGESAKSYGQKITNKYSQINDSKQCS